jgi:hypothetical protein
VVAEAVTWLAKCRLNNQPSAYFGSDAQSQLKRCLEYIISRLVLELSLPLATFTLSISTAWVSSCQMQSEFPEALLSDQCRQLTAHPKDQPTTYNGRSWRYRPFSGLGCHHQYHRCRGPADLLHRQYPRRRHRA